MVRLARAELFDPAEVAILHVMGRVVRRCFLFGFDPVSGKNSRFEGTLLFVTGLTTSYSYDALNRITSVKTQNPDNQWYFTGTSFGKSKTLPTTSSVIVNSDLQNYAASNVPIINAPAADQTNQGLVRDYNYFSAATNEIQITESFGGTDPRLSKITLDRLNRITKTVSPNPDSGQITSTSDQKDPNGGFITKTEYDNLGNVTKSIDSLNNATIWTYDDLNRVTKISEPHPTSTSSTFDTTIVYTANGAGWQTISTNPLGLTSIIQADMLGRPTNVSGTSQPTKSIRYWMDGNLQSTTDELNRITRYSYDQRGRMTAIETPPADTSSTVAIYTTSGYTSFGYTIDSLLSTVTKPLNRITTYQYDVGGRLQQVTEPDPDGAGSLVSAFNRITRDSIGNVRSQSDELSQTTSFTQDAWFRNQSKIEPQTANSAVTTTVYDEFGNVTSVNDPLNNLTSYTYNKLNQLTTEAKGTGTSGMRNYAYDAAGNLKQLTDRNARVTRYFYDNRYRLTSETWNSTQVTQKQLTSNVATLTIGAHDFVVGQTVHVVIGDAKFDGAALITVKTPTTISYSRIATNVALTSLTVGTEKVFARVIDSIYDTADRLTGVLDSDPLALDFEYTYDSRSQLQAERQLGSSYLLTKSINFDRKFDAVGSEVKLEANIGGAVTLTSDGYTFTSGIWDFRTNYGYDGRDRVTSITQSNRTDSPFVANTVAPKYVKMTYNNASERTDISRFSTLTPGSSTPLEQEVNTRNSFDNAGRLKSVTHSKSAIASGVNWDGTSAAPTVDTVTAYFLNYDSDNRITDFASRADGFKAAYTYDVRDQITNVSTAQISGLAMPFAPTSDSFNLDSNGNRNSTGGASQSAIGTHNRLQTDGTYNYAYDNEGNATRRTKISDGKVTDYTWDHRNRLTTVAEKINATTTVFTKKTEYTYDAFDQRTAKRVNVDGNTTWDRYEVYSWADGQEVMRWVDSDGQAATQSLRLANRYLWSDAVDQLLSDEQYLNNTGFAINGGAVAVAGNTLWALNDHQGSVRDLIDNNGIIRQHVVYDSFGKRIREVDYNTAGTVIASNNAAAIDTVFGYTGRDWDTDIGMQYNRARWYDPSNGRWLSQDPIGFAAGDANLYRYVGNHPTIATDPSGLQEPNAAGPTVLPWVNGNPGETYPVFENYYFEQDPIRFMFRHGYSPKPLGLGLKSPRSDSWLVVSWRYTDFVTNFAPMVGEKYNRCAASFYPFSENHHIVIEPNNNWGEDTEMLLRILKSDRIVGVIFVGHGGPGNIGGTGAGDSITVNSLMTSQSPQLEFLKTLGAGMPPDGVARIRMCDVSDGPDGQALLKKVANILDVRVWATDYTYAIIPLGNHEYQDPKGRPKGPTNPFNPWPQRPNSW